MNGFRKFYSKKTTTAEVCYAGFRYPMHRGKVSSRNLRATTKPEEFLLSTISATIWCSYRFSVLARHIQGVSGIISEGHHSLRRVQMRNRPELHSDWLEIITTSSIKIRHLSNITLNCDWSDNGVYLSSSTLYPAIEAMYLSGQSKSTSGTIRIKGKIYESYCIRWTCLDASDELKA